MKMNHRARNLVRMCLNRNTEDETTAAASPKKIKTTYKSDQRTLKQENKENLLLTAGLAAEKLTKKGSFCNETEKNQKWTEINPSSKLVSTSFSTKEYIEDVNKQIVDTDRVGEQCIPLTQLSEENQTEKEVYTEHIQKEQLNSTKKLTENSSEFQQSNANIDFIFSQDKNCTILSRESNLSSVPGAFPASPIVDLDNPPSIVIPVDQSPLNFSPLNAPHSLDEVQLESPFNTNILPSGICIDESLLSGADSSPLRNSSPISGVAPIDSSESDHIFSDSGSSWVPDREENLQLENLRKRKAKFASSSSESDEEPHFNLLETSAVIETNLKERPPAKIVKLNKNSTSQSRNIIVPASSDSDTIIDITESNIEDDIHSPSQAEIVKIKTNSTPMLRHVTIPASSDSDTIMDITESINEDDRHLQIESQSHLHDKEQEAIAVKGKQMKSNVRWKKSNPEIWKKNVEAENRRNGLIYINKTGKSMEAKKPRKSKCDDKCRFSCNKEFNEEQRNEICREYWSIKDYKQQKNFLLRYIEIKPIQRTLSSPTSSKKRTNSREYSFYKDQTIKTRICKSFLMSTLCISTGPIETAVKHVTEYGAFTRKDKRGSNTPINKTSEEKINEVHEHIKSFPLMDSHYCRQKTTRQYLDANLTIAKMYSLYLEKMKVKNLDPVKFNIYKRVFGTEYNISFFRPKKDQCCLCNKYNRCSEPDEKLTQEYTDHIKRKEAAYKAKEVDKKRAKDDKSFICTSMDLQSLLQIPSTADSLMYYSRKLNLYNLSIYESNPPKHAYCYIWTEINGKRGSTEIASAVNTWFKNLPEIVTEVTIYSDTCAGQNRNQYIAAFFLHLVQATSIKIIEQKYLESGHTYMEVDSMHSAIEREKRYTDVFSIIDWKNIMQRARSQRNNPSAEPYNVVELTYSDMIDVKALATDLIKNRNICDDGQKINWLKIKRLRYEKEFPGIIKFSYDYDGEYSTLNTFTKYVRTTRRTPASETSKSLSDCPVLENKDLPMMYKKPLPISLAKKRDLLNLCKKGVIPTELHAWYEKLPTSTTVVDCIPEPDGNDEEDENLLD